MTEQLTQTQLDDKKFILNPGKWPRWPHLPMKYNGKDAAANQIAGGFLGDLVPIGEDDLNHPCYRTVIMVCIWEFNHDPENASRKAKDRANWKEYESVEAMLLDGWAVD
jgi:hypothetical protein